jgi:uncharacterized protein YlxW (UPF0749 family)
MKRILLALLLPGTMFVMSFSAGQTPDANQEQKLLALIKEVQRQQAQLAENQAKIEEKLADFQYDCDIGNFKVGRHGNRCSFDSGRNQAARANQGRE